MALNRRYVSTVVYGAWALLLSTSVVRAAPVVEVLLVDKLDEPRGFCLDIVGSQQRATPAHGLQAHSCYSYQGRIAVDQGFDGERLTIGEFYLPHFDVCMTIAAAEAGSRLVLARCDGSARQRFDFASGGSIAARADSSLCLTVGDGESRPGGGGNPPHLIRRLSIRSCSPTLEKFQKWRIRETAE